LNKATLQVQYFYKADSSAKSNIIIRKNHQFSP